MFKSLLKIFLVATIILFISSYLISNSGYYEYTLKQQTTITNEKIKEFEEDIKNNKDISVTDYLKKDEKDYTNKISNIIYNISTKTNNITKKIIKNIFKKLSVLVNE